MIQKLTFLLSVLTISVAAISQSAISLNDLSFFKTPGPSWRIAGEVTADLNKPEVMSVSPGNGVLLNIPVNKNGADLYSNTEYGDIDLELDYMLAKGSNSGIYLQGRYEYQLLDSWLVKNPTSADNGGIYERWDDKRPEGSKGYGGYAPRQNVSKAPGLWQHVKISFQAPRFGSNGEKIENAKMLRVELNGVLIHDNIELQAPTRGAMSEAEKATAPLRFQGDHGAVAFRNIKITGFDRPRPTLTDLKYSVYKGRYDAEKNLAALKPEAQGSLTVLSAGTINNVPEEFFIRYNGTIKVQEAGNYLFNVAVPGGRGTLTINGTAVNISQRGSADLPAGNLPFELLYAKVEDWKNLSLTMFITGPGIRRYAIGDPVLSDGGDVDPIYVEAPVNTILRSFINLYPGVRSVHAVSVGSPAKIHYTYDLDYGAIVQVWRGGFLDATPMWHDRGNGTSVPVGAVLRFGKPAFLLSTLTSSQTAWRTDTTGSSYRPGGYRLNKTDAPAFMYQVEGAIVVDATTVTGEGQGFKREVTIKNAPANFYARLAEAGSIQAMEDGMYLIEGGSYYLRIDDNGGANPVIRDMNGRKELIIALQNKLSYSILF